MSQINVVMRFFNESDIESAIELFDQLPYRDTTARNATIFGLGKKDHGQDAINLFITMKDKGVL